MWDISLEISKNYNIPTHMVCIDESDENKDIRTYTISKSNGKFIRFKKGVECKGKFVITKKIKEDFSIFHPFRKRQIIQYIFTCIDDKEYR